MFYYRFRSATFRISSLIYWPLIEQDGFFILNLELNTGIDMANILI